MVEKRRLVAHMDYPAYSTFSNPSWTTPGSEYVETQYPAFPLQSLEKTVTTGHDWRKLGRATTDVGGDFTTHKVTELRNFFPQPITDKGWGYGVYGHQWPASPGTMMAEALRMTTPSSDLALMKLGSTAISRTIPTNPLVDGATAIGELKSGIPQLVGKELLKSKFKDYRKVGGEYLNVEFGWKPIISDLQATAKSVMESEKILEQLHRDSGKGIRRKYSFPEERTFNAPANWTVSSHSWVGGLNVYPKLRGSTGVVYPRVSSETWTKTWFSGQYTYHLNLGNTLRDKMERNAAEARRLYGLELTPATVWNLAPWSWLVDWEGNIGDVLHNVSRFSQDGLVLRYGYIMQEKYCKLDVTLHPNGGLRGTKGTLAAHVIAKSKVRRRATPFGFGFDMSALNGRQTAILGALGIARGPRHR